VNHLAHLLLGGPQPELLIGNLAGDFVHGPLRERFTPEVRAGIVMHRRIDAFTDTHAAVGESRRIIAVRFGHYSRIIADIFFDHFLAVSWDAYVSESLEGFLERSFALLDGHVVVMPEGLQRVYPHMRDGSWFRSYATLDGIHMALAHTSNRLSRRPDLAAATSLLVEKHAPLRQWFESFFPDVMAYASELRNGRHSGSGTVPELPSQGGTG
jgi:acyl carrier protein phosphodiesterase